MKEMTAAEAARNFSAVLSAAEKGETVLVTRSGRRVALITPAPRSSGRALRAVFEDYRAHPIGDDEWTTTIDEALTAVSPNEDVDPWND
ncbi:MAG: type II toxin-antitoxin system prevent-host-death family antitoxin [Actinophytocola sp.]|nr:type II toxin-antitoxin system prevent-host-death family antitoxin [Actinophytocola sp.]